MYSCTRCGIKHRRSSNKGKEHLKWEKKEDNVPTSKYFKITKKQFKLLSPHSLKQIWRLYCRKECSPNKKRYIIEINKVLLNDIRNLT